MIHTVQPITRHSASEELTHSMLHDVNNRVKRGDKSQAAIYTQMEPYCSVWCWDCENEWSTAIPNPDLPGSVRLTLVGRPIWEAVQIESLRHHPWARSIITEISDAHRGDGTLRKFIRIRSILP